MKTAICSHIVCTHKGVLGNLTRWRNNGGKVDNIGAMDAPTKVDKTWAKVLYKIAVKSYEEPAMTKGRFIPFQEGSLSALGVIH